jgi:predicted nucleic acid-binding protein
MNLFFDTSSLFKLYHQEDGTEDLLNLFATKNIEKIFITEITIVEFSSAVWKKCRKKEIDIDTANFLIEKFDADLAKYSIVPTMGILHKNATRLIMKYWHLGLRTLDSIQLSSVLEIKPTVGLFLTSDKVLAKIATLEGLSVK